MLDSYRFCHTLRVRYSEIDGQKIVFNAHYLNYMGVAFIEYIRKVIGENWAELAEKHIFDVALVNVQIDYKAPAKLDDLLQVYCKIKQLGRSSIHLSVVITREKEVLAEIKAVYVNYHSALGEAQAIPADIRAKIIEFEKLES